MEGTLEDEEGEDQARQPGLNHLNSLDCAIRSFMSEW